MMHESEKSDSVVVAVKSANKAEQSVTELAEPRTGTKGNANQQSTRRAQDRESVSQALIGAVESVGDGLIDRNGYSFGGFIGLLITPM